MLEECSDVNEALAGPVAEEPDSQQLEEELQRLLASEETDDILTALDGGWGRGYY